MNATGPRIVLYGGRVRFDRRTRQVVREMILGILALGACALAFSRGAHAAEENPKLDSAAAELPPQIMTAIRQADEPQRIRRSLDGAIAEIKLRGNIRAAIAAAGSAGQCPRLIIASSMREKPETWLAKRLVNPHNLELTYQAIEQLLQRQATLHRASRLIALPYSHASLVTNRESAARIAAQLQEFLP